MLEEPLALSAPLARRLAAERCRVDPHSGETCAWTHGFWQYLRLLGLAVTPDRHAAFLQAALARVARERDSPRILISGAVDYGMLAQVLSAMPGGRARITILDICDTPLEVNRWYAARQGARVRTLRCDILDCTETGAYDAICTHAFMGYFDDAQRAALAAKWRDLLAPGGRAITVHRLRPGEREWIVLDAAQARAYCDSVREATGAAGGLGLAPEELADLAATYARRLRLYPVPSLDYVRGLFEGAGLGIEELTAQALPAAARGAASAPTVPGDNAYFHLVATRR